MRIASVVMLGQMEAAQNAMSTVIQSCGSEPSEPLIRIILLTLRNMIVGILSPGSSPRPGFGGYAALICCSKDAMLALQCDK